MAVPQFDVVVDALVATLQAYPGLSALGGTGFPVFDGPALAGEKLEGGWLAVGYNAVDGPQIRDNQAWHDMGTQATRDSVVEVDCMLVVTSGDADFSTLRTTAATYLGYVSNALRATPALGCSNVLWSELVTGDVTQDVSAKGAYVELPFLVRIACLI